MRQKQETRLSKWKISLNILKQNIIEKGSQH
jgi:hypothetical protein